MSARKRALEVLGNQPEGKMDSIALSRELQRSRVLGAGVEVWHVIWSLQDDGLVIFDYESGEVKLNKT